MKEEGGVSKSMAVMACNAMTFFYVAILYSPTLILRLSPPTSVNSFMIRCFICAAISTIVSLIVSALILPMRNWEVSHLFGVYGIRLDHISLLLVNSWKEYNNQGGSLSFNCIKDLPQKFLGWMFSLAFNILAWRNYVVAPLTEELVFRACMIPLLLCGGFKTYSVIFLCPICFSLAHLNHLLELCIRQDSSLLKAFMVVGLQLGYTVIFGSFASFLFIRTGHLVAPIVAHIFCNLWDCLCSSHRGMGWYLWHL